MALTFQISILDFGMQKEADSPEEDALEFHDVFSQIPEEQLDQALDDLMALVMRKKADKAKTSEKQ